MPDYQAKFPPRLLSAWENHCLGRNIHILLEPVYEHRAPPKRRGAVLGLWGCRGGRPGDGSCPRDAESSDTHAPGCLSRVSISEQMGGRGSKCWFDLHPKAPPFLEGIIMT